MFSNSQEVIEYITKRTRRDYGLSEFKGFMMELNNPQYQLKCIHVAGTNGKGSTTNYLRSILQTAGYKVGSFTSPHLESHHDRIRINDVPISDETLVEYANKYVDKWNKHGLTMFEIDMFISVMYFIEEKVDFVIYEVGLGGEKDATNIIKPLVSVITSIGYDHMQYLGNSIEEIAGAKAGIIKEKTPLVTAEDKANCLAVFKEVCKTNETEMFLVCPATSIHVNDKIRFDYKNLKNIEIQTGALYQVSNACTAIETILYLQSIGIVISEESIYSGLYNTLWKGRYEKVMNDPLVYLDGAHNEHGIKALVETLKLKKVPITIVFAALKDKETSKMIQMLLEVANELVVTQFDFYRAKRAIELAEDYPVTIIDDWKEAISHALKNNQGMVLVTGSLYFISDVRLYFKEMGYLE